ncbi:GAF and ANTAR domain-containing protein [Nocardioides korecus]
MSTHLASDAHPVRSHQRIVDLICKVEPAATWAGITSWPERGPARTLAHSAGFPVEVDAIQYELGQGPCISAAVTGTAVLAADLTSEKRWSTFVLQTLSRTPVRGVLALHLAGGSGRQALNLYSDDPGAFDDDAVAVGTLLATHAGMLMAHAESAHQIHGLEVALDANRVIGAASGMLMATYSISQDEAFQLLRRTSNDLNRKLRDVAAELTDTGKLPTD